MIGRQRPKNLPSEKNDQSYPSGSIVLGPDGNLYRLVDSRLREKEDDVSQVSSAHSSGSAENEEPKEDAIQSPKKWDHMNVEILDEDELSRDESTVSEEWHDCNDIIGENDSCKKHPAQKEYTYRPKWVTPLDGVSVEDVPDEEDDELRDIHSVWRNRVPSPGQWMEPVESFQ